LLISCRTALNTVMRLRPSQTTADQAIRRRSVSIGNGYFEESLNSMHREPGSAAVWPGSMPALTDHFDPHGVPRRSGERTVAVPDATRNWKGDS
jgi:hypothetical protein